MKTGGIAIGDMLDKDKDISVIMSEYGNYIMEWIDKDQAIEIITHLTKVFELNEK